ncbi:DUF6417 family protein [Streptomyces yokosukanensis]|uniref:DUF6417 family protein n=1 Tax=Streptomyces yokosukanensis TaxID=67386 RepID=UPI000A979366|nr:DUF6417 family protein [Streptomyces yokosukanensis]
MARNLWSLRLGAGQVESVAYAFYLRSMGGCATEANRFAREYGLAFHIDSSAGCPRLTRLPGDRAPASCDGAAFGEPAPPT